MSENLNGGGGIQRGDSEYIDGRNARGKNKDQEATLI